MSESLKVQVYKYTSWLGRILNLANEDTRLKQLDAFLNTISNNSTFLYKKNAYGDRLNELYKNAQKEFIYILKNNE